MAVLWNASDKSANITLSGGSLTAASSSATQGAVRADTSFSSGKLYFEITANSSIAGGSSGFGWANSTASLGSFIGNDKNGVANYPTNGTNGQIWFNNASIGTGAGPSLTSVVFCIAFDIGGLKIWARRGGFRWDETTDDPATATGGYSVSTMNAGPYFPVFCSNHSGENVTVNFGATPFVFPVPSGFSPVDPSGTGFTNFAGSSKFLSVPILGTAQTVAAASKLLGTSVLGTQQNAAAASKLLGTPILGTQQNAVAASKMLAIAILRPVAAVELSQGYIFG